MTILEYCSRDDVGLVWMYYSQWERHNVTRSTQLLGSSGYHDYDTPSAFARHNFARAPFFNSLFS